MNNAINMLPCPMCGCSSINVKNEQPTDNSGGYFIECPDCGISTSLRYACGDDPIPLLAEQWNRRATTQCLHQIAEPAAPVGKPIEDAIDALVMAAFTEGGCSEHRMSEARIQTELRKKKLRTLLSTPQPCSRSHPHEEMTPMCELRTEIARLTNALARAEAQLAAAPQAAAPLFWVRLLRDGLYEGPVHNNSVGGKMLRDEKPGEWHPLYLHAAPAHPAEGVPAQPLQMFESPRAKILMQAWQEGFAACRDAEYVGEEAENDAFNQSMTLNHCIAEDELHATHPTRQGLDAQELLAALGDLSFACFGGIGTKAPDAATYNSTFAVFQKHRDAAQAKQGEQA